MNSSRKKAAFYTLGCKLNFSETSTIARQLEEQGIIRAGKGEKADICIVNTCSVTDHADKKCRNIIRRIVRENPSAIVAVTGCYAQLKAEEIASIEGVDLVIGNNDKGKLRDRIAGFAKSGKAAVYTCDTEEITSFFSAFSSGDRTRAYLKVQDGCDYKCSYCTIPLARGNSRNISILEIVAEAEAIARKGQKEIVITGINTGDFGKTTGEKFTDLLKALDAVEGIERYRISSIEPNLLTDEVISFCAQSLKFQPHFHIPLQSGCDHILGLMRRRYTTRVFSDRINALRKSIPDVFIGIDVIVGFPGETEADFSETFNFLKELRPAFLHVFPFSVRPNTPAAGFEGKISSEISSQRVKALTELSDQLHDDFMRKHLGSEQRVLCESTLKGGLMYGYTGNYLRVEVPYSKKHINSIVPVKLISVTDSGTVRGVLSD